MQDHEDADIQPVSCNFLSQGLALHYVDWGNDAKPLLILVHGARDHARSWDETARALRNDWHVVALDLRGHGDSAWSPDGAYNLTYHVVDLAELIAHLGEERVTIVAHSLGGSITSRVAALYPDRIDRLVIVDGLGPRPAAIAEWTAAGSVKRLREWVDKRRDLGLRRQRRFATIDEAVARMAAANPHLTAEQARHLAVHGVRKHDGGFSWKYDPLVFAFSPDDFAKDSSAFWQAIEAPTLICWGTESHTSDAEGNARAAQFRDYRTHEFDRAGHWPHHDRFDAFIEMLKGFLNPPAA